MMASVSLGEMRDLVTVEVPTDVMDDTGATTRIFTVFRQIWCRIKPVKPSARFEADRKAGVVSHTLYFRSDPSFSADWRLRLGARVFQVLSFDADDDRNGFTRAYCEETVS